MKNVIKFAIVACLTITTSGVFATAKNDRDSKAITKQEIIAKQGTKKEEKKEVVEKKAAMAKPEVKKEEKKEVTTKHKMGKISHKKHSTSKK